MRNQAWRTGAPYVKGVEYGVWYMVYGVWCIVLCAWQTALCICP